MFTKRLHLAALRSEYRSCRPHMYTRSLQKAAHIRTFSITSTPEAGWEVRYEQDSHVIRSVRYRDWHRVERARMSFAREAALLEESGWEER
jgi:hypothetical protein